MSGRESQTHFAHSPANAAAPTNGQAMPPAKVRISHVRQFAESLLCLAMAVIVFRTFQVEGYMISTGSMAPSLLGFHKQVVCPTCQFQFAYGVSYQPPSSRTITGDGDEISHNDMNGSDHGERQLCTCPNCGQQAIDISQVPRNQGDQLLVFREAYWLRMPRRWEVIVFRNPYETTQAYVKRLAGLPGETIVIRNGDVYANGTLCRKNYSTQKAMRISVYDHQYEPQDDPEWQTRWRPDAGWQADKQAFLFSGKNDDSPQTSAEETKPAVHGLDLPAPKSAAEDWSWVTYGHALRSGGRHITQVMLPIIEEELKWPPDILPAQFDLKTRMLSITGVMSLPLRERLREVSDHPAYWEAVDQLYHRSHYAPVTDDYGYNRVTHQSGQNAVRDVMLSLQMTALLDQPSAAHRQFAIDMTDGGDTFRVLLDFASREIRLLGNPEIDPQAAPLRTAAMPADCLVDGCQLEMSLIDRQVTVAVNGKEPFDAWPITSPWPTQESPRFPVRFGTKGLAAQVESLQLFRDVYYTGTNDEKPFVLKDNELYVLGDNSPVSLDSRRWDNGAVPMRLLLGKPFVVHLPSRQMKIRLGDSTRHIRIPDFPRVRYIR